MTASEALDKLLPGYEAYYDVNRDTPHPPFDAEAVFFSHNEQYYLVKKAKVADIDTTEYVFFAVREVLDKEMLNNLSDIAWQYCLDNTKAETGHKSTDVTLFILTDSLNGVSVSDVKAIKHSMSYMFGIHGYSRFRIAVINASDGNIYTNPMGKIVKKSVTRLLEK